LECELEKDVIVYPFTLMEGKCRIGSGSAIGPFSYLRDSQIGINSVIESSTLNSCTIGNNVVIGPYSYIRPGTIVMDNGKVGAFVEVKKSAVGKNSKIPHLSYIGDATIGESVNIGAGTITCNYDGHNKHHTHIGNDVFVGSNTNLVAPVTVGDGATIGAGSTITKDVPRNALSVARARQVDYRDRACFRCGKQANKEE
jgi:bifunctional UDP-N-acetylglucosamine pyrophosphorylase/glucosamine-1-phosphate N-acetyltransferase